MANRNARGLCAECAHARLQRSRRGSEFLRCARADRDPGYLRYPPLPVLACPGFERRTGEARGGPRGSGVGPDADAGD